MPSLGGVKPATAAVPDSLGGIAARVERRMSTLLEAERARWRALDQDLDEPLEQLARLVMAGGKRLRPAFCHWAFVGLGGDGDDPAVIDAGAALELLHTFALIHDDIMDGSLRRRGLDTVHLRFEATHTLAGWRGEGRRFGEGVAILVGDLAFVYADLLLAGAPGPALAVFNELRLEVNIGQYLDLLGTARGDATLDQARRICQYKSGRYPIERPLHLGAALAGRLHECEAALSAFGGPLGEAFQLRDDLLGAFGDPDVTGKPVGEDLREGKPTALYAIAAGRATEPATRLLRERFGAADLGDDDIAALQQILIDTGARAEVEATIDRLVEQAVDALDGITLTGEATDRLRELAWFVAGRDY